MQKVYMKAAGSELYAHAKGGSTKAGNWGTLHPCPKSHEYANCMWSFEPSFHPNAWYIKTSDTPLYLHVATGRVKHGDVTTLHSCPVVNDHHNCQWVIEPSKTRSGHVYIKSFGSNLYLHAKGGNSGGARLTLHPCHKRNDYSNCQWAIEDWCKDVRPSEQCLHWTGRGLCAQSGVRTLCKKTCGRCGHTAMTTRGEWKLLMSQTNGGIEYEVSTGITTETGTVLTDEKSYSLGASISNTLKFGSHLLVKAENEVEVSVNAEHSWASAQEVSEFHSREKATTTKVSCGEREGSRNKVWLYQWVITQGHTSIHSAHTRCHYTEGLERAPECPLGACGRNNEWCEAVKCDNWMETGTRRLEDEVMV